MGWHVKPIEKLSSGGFGEIWLADRSDTGERVVVKYLQRSDEESMEFFRREIFILKKRTEGLVEYLGANLDGDRPFYVMKYYQRGSLAQHAGALSSPQLRSVAKQLASCLAVLHREGIAHGDVKPDNILVTGAGSVRVGDPLGKGTGCTVMYGLDRGGTPGYWAPEVANGASMSVAADVFSYGATLFHMATGRRPQDGQRFDAAAVSGAAPKDIGSLILACCDPDPQKRPRLSRVVTWLEKKNVGKVPVAASKDDMLGTLAGAGAAALCVLLVVALLDS